MSRLLRNSKTGQYYQSPGQWTSDPKQAQAFEHTAQAIGLAYQMKLSDVEILLAFEDASYNLRFPLRPYFET